MKPKWNVVSPAHYLCRSFALPSPLSPEECREYLSQQIPTLFPFRMESTRASLGDWGAVVLPSPARNPGTTGFVWIYHASVPGTGRHSVPFCVACLSRNKFKEGRYVCVSERHVERVVAGPGSFEYVREDRTDRSADGAHEDPRLLFGAGRSGGGKHADFFFADADTARGLDPDSAAAVRVQPDRIRPDATLLHMIGSRRQGFSENRATASIAFIAFAFCAALLIPAVYIHRTTGSALESSRARQTRVQQELALDSNAAGAAREVSEEYSRLLDALPVPIHSVLLRIVDSLRPGEYLQAVTIQERSVTLTAISDEPLGLLDSIRTRSALTEAVIDQIHEFAGGGYRVYVSARWEP